MVAGAGRPGGMRHREVGPAFRGSCGRWARRLPVSLPRSIDLSNYEDRRPKCCPTATSSSAASHRRMPARIPRRRRRTISRSRGAQPRGVRITGSACSVAHSERKRASATSPKSGAASAVRRSSSRFSCGETSAARPGGRPFQPQHRAEAHRLAQHLGLVLVGGRDQRRQRRSARALALVGIAVQSASPRNTRSECLSPPRLARVALSKQSSAR